MTRFEGSTRALMAPRDLRFRLMLAALAGAAQAASLAWPLNSASALAQGLGLTHGQPVWWLQVLALGVLAGLLQGWRHEGRSQPQRAWRAAALTGGVFATAWLAGTFWWTYIALHTYGGLPALLAGVAVLALAALLALYYAAICGLFVALAPTSQGLAALFFGALWLLAELARGVWLTGFGWGAVGYAHVSGPLAAYAPWIGAYGLCALAAWMAMTLAAGLRRANAGGTRQWRLPAALVLGVLALPHLPLWGPLDPTTSSGHLSVTLLQGNIPQDEKFEPGSGVPQALQWYSEQLHLSRTPLVIAPETAIPLLPQQLRPDYWQSLLNRFSSGEQAALIGMPLGRPDEGYTNSVIALQPGQDTPWQYDKHHLVPFGEFIPPLFRWFTEMMNIPLGDFNRGAPRQPPLVWQGQRLALNICYEDLFGEELGRQFTNPAQAPTIFVNVSNLAWFGNSLAMDQHLHIARLRALEFARPFLLATNTGATAILDHRGQVLSALARDTRGVLVGQVQGRDGTTFFARWVAQWGLWPYWAFVLGALGLAVPGALTKRSATTTRRL